MAALVKFCRTVPVFRQIARVNRGLSYLATTTKKPVFSNYIPKHNLQVIRNVVGNAAVTESEPRYQESTEKSELYWEKLSHDLDILTNGYERVLKSQYDKVLVEAEKIEFKISKDKCLLLLRCTGDLMLELEPSARAELTDSLWAKFKQYGIELDHVFYNVLLTVYLQNGRKFSTAEILGEMQERGLQPNRVTYQRFIAGYCEEGNIEAATQILDHMKNENIPISAGVFHSFIKGHTRANDPESAKNVLNIMREVGLEVSGAAYEALLRGLIELKDFDGVREVLKEAQGVSMSPNQVISLLILLTKNGYTDLNEELYEMLGRMGFMNQTAINQLNEILALGYDDVAHQIVDKTLNSVNPRQQHYISRDFLLFLAANNRPVDKVYEMVNDLKEDVRDVAKNAFILENPDYACDILQKCADEGIPVPPHCYIPALVQYRNQNNKEKLIETMKKIKNSPGLDNTELINILLTFFTPALTSMGEDTESIEKISTEIGLSKEMGTALGLHILAASGFADAVQYFSDKTLHPFQLSNVQDVFINKLQAEHDWENALKFSKICHEQMGLQTFNFNRSIIRDLMYFCNVRLDWSKAEEFLDNNEKQIRLLPNGFRTLSFDNVPSPIVQRISKMVIADGYRDKLSPDGEDGAEMLRKMCDMAVKSNDLEKALEFYTKIEDKYPEYAFYYLTALNMAALYIENGRAQEAIDLLKNYASRHSSYLKQRGFDSTNNNLAYRCRYVKNEASRKCPESVDEILKTLLSCGFINENRFYDAHKYDMVDLDTQSDDDVFELLEEMITKYSNNFDINHFIARFVKSEQPDQLQKVIDMAVPVFTEDTILSNLVVNFMIHGHPKKALKIFESSNRQLAPQVCDLFIFYDKLNVLEQFAELTKDSDKKQRDEILFGLIRGYAKVKSVNKALDVLVQYEEENTVPKDKTLRYLAKVCETAGINVPFEVPAIVNTPGNVRNETRVDNRRKLTQIDLKFPEVLDLVQSEDVEKIMEAKAKVDADQNENAAVFLPEVLNVIGKNEKGHKVLTYLRQNQKVDDLLSILNTSYPISQAIKTTAKKVYFGTLQDMSENAKIEELVEKNKEDINNYLSVNILKKLKEDNPDLFSKVESIVLSNPSSGMNSLLAYYIVSDYDKAKDLLQKEPGSVAGIKKKSMLNLARVEKKEEIFDRIIDITRQFNKTSLFYIYSHYIDMCVKGGDLDTVLNIIKKMEADNLSPQDMHEVMFNRLEVAFKENNRLLPWQSNAGDTSSDSSDSDSDSDVKKPK
ncbi:leucine-rich PPR motif-containing protein, mitochondrial [Patella vulgata]|uniref:leucine-rich PPR motif-containing protein, mitochondrial n=1 Tax=Patella vulgata TaxID=6465 RepID=UPI00217FBB73|nr:leucine-rich PPR motif-containing protein, mitochondrial [Patella vulgata]